MEKIWHLRLGARVRPARDRGLRIDQLAEDVWCRHPLAFLVEAADDICYGIIDIEDGYALGLVSYDDASEAFRKAIALVSQPPNASDKLAEYRDAHTSLTLAQREHIAYLRGNAINALIKKAVEAFKNNYDAIMTGQRHGKSYSLLDSAPDVKEVADALSGLARRCCYDSPSVLKVELAGYSVLGGLLSKLVPAAAAQKAKGRAKKALGLLGRNFEPAADPSDRIRQVVDFVAGMTDRFAVTTYRSVEGFTI